MATISRQLIAGVTASTSRPLQLREAKPAHSISLIRRNHIDRLRLPLISLRSKPWMVEAIPPVKSWKSGFDGGEAAEMKKKPGACGYAIGDKEIGGSGGHVADRNFDRAVEVAVAAAATAALGVGNRVMYKLALVPLKHYPFFLAQLSTFGYVAVYYAILYLRQRAGTVTDEMLSVPKMPFLVVGILEALAAAAGMAAAVIYLYLFDEPTTKIESTKFEMACVFPFLDSANLSGPSTTVLSQTFLVWQILFSVIFLGRRYSINQLSGCALVALGVIVSVASGTSAAHSLKEAGIFWSLLMVLSFLLQGADTVLKEVIFLDYAKRIKGASLDLFIVNSYGSAFQAIFIALLLPFLSKLWGIPFNQLPSYLRDGAVCFLNIGTTTMGCDGAPLLPMLFVIVNIAYNIALLHLLKISTAVVSCLASTISVPIAVYMFTLPLPYLGVASSLPTGFVAGTIILVLGMILYAWTPSNGSNSAVPSAPPT